jgi:hypothetical protein
VDQWGSWADVLWISGAVGQMFCGSVGQLGRCAVDQWGGRADVLQISWAVGQVCCGSVGQLGS